jgi:hypothetical protein
MVDMAGDLSGLAGAIRDARGMGWTTFSTVERASESDADATEDILRTVELGRLIPHGQRSIAFKRRRPSFASSANRSRMAST